MIEKIEIKNHIEILHQTTEDEDLKVYELYNQAQDRIIGYTLAHERQEAKCHFIRTFGKLALICRIIEYNRTEYIRNFGYHPDYMHKYESFEWKENIEGSRCKHCKLPSSDAVILWINKDEHHGEILCEECAHKAGLIEYNKNGIAIITF